MERLMHVLVPEDLIQRIEDFRFTWRFDSRAAAVRWLIEWALSQKPQVR